MATTILNLSELTFPAGLIGCPEWRNFRLEQRPDLLPVMMLHALEQPGLSFIVADPHLWFPAYQAEISPAEHELLGAGPDDPLLTLAILTVEPQPFRVTANLLGPLVVNPANGRACQIVQANRPYLAAQPIGLETRALVFAEGWVGCPDWRAFVLHESPQTYPVRLLVSRDQPRLSLPVVDPWLVNPDYAPRLADAEREALGLEAEQQPEWLCVLDLGDDPRQATANLLGPLVFNPQTGAARQVILTHSAYSARQAVGGDLVARTGEVAYARADATA